MRTACQHPPRPWRTFSKISGATTTFRIVGTFNILHGLSELTQGSFVPLIVSDDTSFGSRVGLTKHATELIFNQFNINPMYLLNLLGRPDYWAPQPRWEAISQDPLTACGRSPLPCVVKSPELTNRYRLLLPASKVELTSSRGASISVREV